MLMLAFGDLFERQPLIFVLKVGPADLACDPLRQLAENESQRFHAAVVVFLSHRGADLRLAQLHLAFFRAAECGLAPCRYTVKQIPVFERHPYRGSRSHGLTEDAQSLGIGIAQPVELRTMRLWMLVDNQHRIVKQWTPALTGQ